jgi:hypothetical protein
MNKPGYYWENVPRLHREMLQKYAQEDEKGILHAIKEGLWSDTRGLFENIFNLATYFLPLVAGWGWAIMILDIITTNLWGFGLASLGKIIDGFVGTTARQPVQDVGAVLGKTERFFGWMFTQYAGQQSTSSRKDELKKTAFLGGMLKLMGLRGLLRLAPRLIKILDRLIRILLGAGIIGFAGYKTHEYLNPESEDKGDGEQVDVRPVGRPLMPPPQPLASVSMTDLKDIFDIRG